MLRRFSEPTGLGNLRVLRAFAVSESQDRVEDWWASLGVLSASAVNRFGRGRGALDGGYVCSRGSLVRREELGLTQSPYPYPPPGGPPRDFGPFDPLAPSRRASVLLFVLGGLAVLGGLCLGAFPWIAPIDTLVEQIKASLPPEQLAQLPPGWTLEQILRVYYVALGIVGVGIGVLLLCLAPFVRRGGRGSTVTALVVFVLIGAGCALGVLAVLLQLARGPSPAAIGSLFLIFVMGVAVAAALIFLGQALRAANRLAWHWQQMRARYWHYQQQPGYAPGVQGGGYGYGYLPPPPPQQPPAPPAPSPSDQPPASNA